MKCSDCGLRKINTMPDREQTLALIALTTEAWLGAELNQASDEALLTLAFLITSLAVFQRIKRGGAVSFSEPM